MKKNILLLLSLSVILISCQNRGSYKENKEDDKVPAIKPFLHDIDKRAMEHVESVIDHYLHIQMALVRSDSTEAKAGAVMILNEMNKFDTLILQGNDRAEYNRFNALMKENAGNLSKTSNIGMQRTYFKELSDGAYGLAKAFGYKKTLYRVHCPMAFNHQGADWLSTEKEVKNPYYGQDMLECGSVEEAIDKQGGV